VRKSDATDCDEPFFGVADPWLYWIFSGPFSARSARFGGSKALSR
jgi:hypothetical protein